MKSITQNMKLIFLLTLVLSYKSWGQSIDDEMEFRIPTEGLESFRVHNINGEVTIEGIDGNTAVMKVRRSLKSASSEKLEEAKSTFKMDSLSLNGSLYFFNDVEDRYFKIDEEGKGHYESDWDGSKDDRFEVKYSFEIDLKIPKDLDLHVTNHRANLTINGINGNLYAKNHHDDLDAVNLGGNAMLRNHHGYIKASFTRNPSGDCTFRTHHGDIRVTLVENLSADVFLKSHHGEFYTAFDWTPSQVSANKKTTKEGTTYYKDDRVAVKIGNGGPEFDFKTWHGDIYIEKK